MRPIKAYTYETPYDYVPDDIHRVLGNPSHIRQARVIVFARTARGAWGRLVNLGLSFESEKHLPRVAYGNDVDTLVTVNMNKEDEVFVVSNQLSTVARVFFDESGNRSSALIGVFSNLGQSITFVASQ